MNRRILLLLVCFAASGAHAQSLRDVDKSAGNLMVVLRESVGAKARPDETLEYTGKVKVKTEDGKDFEAEFAHYAAQLGLDVQQYSDPSAPLGILVNFAKDMDAGALADLHVGDLRFLEVRDHPDFRRHDGERSLSR